jgi:hypothetical protein
MKMLKLFLILFFLMQWPLSGKSQNIDNASFDSLCVCAIDRVWQWVTSDTYFVSSDTAQPFLPNTLYTNASINLHFAINTVQLNYDNTDSSGYINSVKIFSRPDMVFQTGDIFRGFIINGEHFFTDNQGFIDLKRCGSAFAYRPDSISGSYKFEDSLSSVAEYGKAKVLLKKYNTVTHSADTIGYAESVFELSPASQWTQFKLPIHYISISTPDSIVVVFFSSSDSGQPASLWLDDIQFTYPTSGIAPPVNNYIGQLYPNPAGGLIHVPGGIAEQSRYIIVDVSGKILQSGTTGDGINIQRLHSGTYLLKIIEKSSQQTFSFIKP